jgi:hypothetical protein
MYLILILIILVELTTELIIKSTIFLPIRVYFINKSKFLEELLTCGYCFSVWASMLWCIIFYITDNMPILVLNSLLNFGIIWLISHRLSNLLHGAIDRYFDTRKDIRYNRE